MLLHVIVYYCVCYIFVFVFNDMKLYIVLPLVRSVNNSLLQNNGELSTEGKKGNKTICS